MLAYYLEFRVVLNKSLVILRFFSKKFCNSKKEATFALPTEGNMVKHV